MTLQERRNPDILNTSRRRRIVRDSGTEFQNANRLPKQFREGQRLFINLIKTGGRGLTHLLA